MAFKYEVGEIVFDRRDEPVTITDRKSLVPDTDHKGNLHQMENIYVACYSDEHGNINRAEFASFNESDLSTRINGPEPETLRDNPYIIPYIASFLTWIMVIFGGMAAFWFIGIAVADLTMQLLAFINV